MRIREQRIIRNGGNFTRDDFDTLSRAFDFRCVKCGKKKELHADHILPVSLGGSSDISNIQPLCKKCNLEKNNKESFDYRKTCFTKYDMDNRIPLTARINFLYQILYQQPSDRLLREIVFGWRLTKEQRQFADKMISDFVWGY